MNRYLLNLIFLLTSVIGSTQTEKNRLFECAKNAIYESKLDDAFEFFSQIIILEPKDSTVYMERGIIREMQHDFEGALLDFSQQIINDDSNADGYFLRGLMHVKLKNYELAILDFQKVNDADDQNADAFYFKANALSILSKNKEALLAYNSAIKITTLNPDYFDSRAKLHAKLGHKQKQKKDLKKRDELIEFLKHS